MRTDGPSIRYRTRAEITPDGRGIRLVSDRLVLVKPPGQPRPWVLVGSTPVDRLDVDEALELMLQLGGAVVEAKRREAYGSAAQAEPQAAPEAAAGVNRKMHLFGPEDGPAVTLTLPLELVEAMQEALRHVPASTGVDGALVDEIRHQLADQRPTAPAVNVPTGLRSDTSRDPGQLPPRPEPQGSQPVQHVKGCHAFGFGYCRQPCGCECHRAVSRPELVHAAGPDDSTALCGVQITGDTLVAVQDWRGHVTCEPCRLEAEL